MKNERDAMARGLTRFKFANVRLHELYLVTDVSQVFYNVVP